MSAERIALMVLAALATAVGAYLSLERSRGRLPPCPVGGGGCATVQHSRYAELAGIPVSTLGTLGGVALFASTFLRPPNGPIVSLGIAVAGALFSAYLTVLEAFVVNAWCTWCLASATLWIASAIVAGARAARVPAVT